MALLVVAILQVAVHHECALLKQDAFSFHSLLSTGTWSAVIELEHWVEGALLTLSFPNEVFIRQAIHATIIEQHQKSTTLRLQPDTLARTLTIQGSGCWNGKSASPCEPNIFCEGDPATSSQPAPAESPVADEEAYSPRAFRIEGTDCRSVVLAWEAPLSRANMEYEVLVSHANKDLSEQAARSLLTSETKVRVDSLQAGSRYWFGLHARKQTSGPRPAEVWSRAMIVDASTKHYEPLTNADLLAIRMDDEQPDTCTSLKLILPRVSECSATDFMAVEWRVSGEGSNWWPVIDRVDYDANPKRVLVVDELDPYKAYEFRVLLHLTSSGSDGNQGSIVEGPSTGLLLVDMQPGELSNAPVAKSLGSAGVHVQWPVFSKCRSDVGIQVTCWNEGISRSWQPLPESEMLRTPTGGVWPTLRCPHACQFILQYTRIIGKMRTGSSPSYRISNSMLPPIQYGRTRLELKLTQTPRGLWSEFEDVHSPWSLQFAHDISQALEVQPSDVNVVEARAFRERVVFDVPGNSTVLSRLTALLLRPMCTRNLAVHRPGRCSSSCGTDDGTGPGQANDGDLRQYHSRYAWQACPGEPSSWWAVNLGATYSNPHVRLFMGPCCAASYDYEIAVRIGNDNSPETARTCGQRIVRDGSSTGVLCEGAGSWVFVVAAPRVQIAGATLSLSEVQVCTSDDVTNPLYWGPISHSIDISAGLLKFDDELTLPKQIAEELLPFDAAARDSIWRLPQHIKTHILSRVLWMLCAGAAGISIVACILWRSCDIFVAIRGQASDFQLTKDEWTNRKLLAGGEVESCEQLELQFGGQKEDLVAITFETSEGRGYSSQLDISAIDSVEHLIAAVKHLGCSVIRGPVDHVSIQYVNDSTGEIEHAWSDPILGESSDVFAAKRATSWRVLIL